MEFMYQFVVDSMEEVARCEVYLNGMGYDIDVTGPVDHAMFDLQDLKPGAVVRARSVYVVTGSKST